MSLWVIALGLSAGYLMNKNLQPQLMQRLEEQKTAYNSAANPETAGPPTSTIRHVQRTLPDADVNESMNIQDLTADDARAIRADYARASAEVHEYENAMGLSPPIQGVWLTKDNYGV
tara:strand:- start:47 stop:397 length:351 start_codon:yes stop_codon:yes gene_type:complete